MAARLSGAVTTAFPEGPPPATLPLGEEPAQVMQSDGPIEAILVADTDLLHEQFWLRRQQFFGREVEEEIAGNAAFLVNAVGNLSGSDALLRLRSRGVQQRPFETVQALKRQAETALQDKERLLQEKLRETRNKVAALEGVQSIEDPSTGETRVSVSLSESQRVEMQALRQEILSIRKQLRDVQRGLREDVDRLGVWLQIINIGLMPAIVAAIAIALAAMRMARRRRHYLVARNG